MNADKDGPRDWDRELAQIDKLIAQNPAGAVPAPAASGGPAVRRSVAPVEADRQTARPPGKYARLFTWVRLGLALALGIGMTQWPYTHGCDLPLLAYMGGVAAVIVAAFWSMVSSWRTRSGVAHFLSIGLLFWGAALAAREVLPRIGYAKQAATWRCTVATPPARQASPPPSTTQSPSHF